MTGGVGRKTIFNRLFKPTLALLLFSAMLWILAGLYAQNRLETAYDARRMAQRVQTYALEMRREEDEFLLQDVQDPRFYRSGSSENVRAQDEFYHSAISVLDEMSGIVPTALLSDLDTLRAVLNDASRIFSQLMSAYVQTGSAESGLKGELKRSLDALERELPRAEVSPAFHLKLVRLRVNEWPHLGMIQYAWQTLEDVGSLRRQLSAFPPKRRQKALQALSQYEKSFRSIRDLSSMIGGTDQGLLKRYYSKLNEEEPLVSQLVKTLEAHAQRERVEAYAIALAAFLASVLISVFFTVRLAHDISGPIHALKDKALLFKENGEKAFASPNQIEEIHLLDETFCGLTQSLDKTQRQLLQSQKMESIGTLAGGIAHDFNNLLAGILAYAGILKKRLSSDPASVRELDIIEQSAERGAELTRQILGFARKGGYEKVKFDVNKTILECRNLLYRTLEKTVTIKADLGKDVSPIIGDPGQVLQTLMNLGVNARDAMPMGGDLMFESQNIEADEHFCKAHGKLKPGSYVRVSVSDTGSGIPKDAQERIFDPFFTTKEVGKGTGLGLSMVYGIMENHGGLVSVYSEIGHGSQFHLYFPAAVTAQLPKPEPSARSADRPASAPRLQGAMILVVDDEALMRNVAKDILESEGASLFLAANGEEALDFLQTNHSIVNLVVMDVIMPKMDGIKTTRELKKLNPELPVILSSGYAESNSVIQLRQELKVGFIQKPYKAEALVAMAESTLAADEASRLEAA
jgi:signal transduction histidine kinase/CheY-like chemotaxis protein